MSDEGQLGAARGTAWVKPVTAVRQKPGLAPTLPVHDCPQVATDYRVLVNGKIWWFGVVLPGMCIDITWQGQLTIIINKTWLVAQVWMYTDQTVEVEAKPATPYGTLSGSPDLDWSRVKSAVANTDGLDVTFEQSDGQLGAVRVPYSQQYPQRSTNEVRLPMTPEEFDAKFPKTVPVFSDEAKMTCTDAALKTYRFVKVGATDTPLQKLKAYALSTPFKSCSDKDAWGVLPSFVKELNYLQSIKLQRLEAKPGYVSQWVDVPFTVPGGYVEYG